MFFRTCFPDPISLKYSAILFPRPCFSDPFARAGPQPWSLTFQRARIDHVAFPWLEICWLCRQASTWRCPANPSSLWGWHRHRIWHWIDCTSNLATSNITARMATSYNILASLAQLHQRDNVPSILHHQKAILHHEKAILHHQKAL